MKISINIEVNTLDEAQSVIAQLAGETAPVVTVQTQPEPVAAPPAAPVEREISQSAIDKAAELGIDINIVKGTGKAGKVIIQDVYRAAKEIKAKAQGEAKVNGAAAGANNTKTETEKQAGSTPAITVDDVRNKLTEVLNTRGGEVCRNLMADFQAINVSSLMPEQYEDFIAAANVVIQG